MTATLTINEHGAVLLPESFRERWGMKPSGKVIAEETDNGVLLKPAGAEIPPHPLSLEQRLVLLKEAQGIWKDRDDLPDFAALRAEADRF